MVARLPNGDSTRDTRRSVYERDLKPKCSNQNLVETNEDLRALTDAIATPLSSEAHQLRQCMYVKS